ncbi:lysophospholipid acyltransferase family protein [Flammeovirgaceae bacterium SG7u.111]|nr:lysophospholipid acyltransferase family protein [Flammeovirgaceae bacterium SG7u.132]WPO36427.1 lysophospholipid acyltransferase family protein [Flammeovirgaceae bacterium SG7u.111]
MKIIKFLHLVWMAIGTVIAMIFLYPAYLVIIPREKWHKYAYQLNKIWSYVIFGFAFMPPFIERRGEKVPKGTPVVFCANHNSYLDIPLMGGLVDRFAVFVGKSDLSNVPLFGYMFRNIHIPVDRGSSRSRYETVHRSREAIEKGKSLVMFPEGGINMKTYPNLKNFKDGAFRIAIEKQVPIVPVTLPYNWIIMHDIGLPVWHKQKVIFHEPIYPTGLTTDDIPKLREQVRGIIREEMKAHFPEKFEEETVGELKDS